MNATVCSIFQQQELFFTKARNKNISSRELHSTELKNAVVLLTALKKNKNCFKFFVLTAHDFNKYNLQLRAPKKQKNINFLFRQKSYFNNLIGRMKSFAYPIINNWFKWPILML